MQHGAMCQKRSSNNPLKSVPMLMVHVRRMTMRVLEPAMLMGMGMWLSGAIFGAVLVPVMLVMHV
jgi:hypothetical protein